MIRTQQQKIVGMEAANRAYEALIQALKRKRPLTEVRSASTKHLGRKLSRSPVRTMSSTPKVDKIERQR